MSKSDEYTLNFQWCLKFEALLKVNDLEFAVIEQKVVEQLRHGNEVLKRMNQVIK